jgi:hypothetical protein
MIGASGESEFEILRSVLGSDRPFFSFQTLPETWLASNGKPLLKQLFKPIRVEDAVLLIAQRSDFLVSGRRDVRVPVVSQNPLAPLFLVLRRAGLIDEHVQHGGATRCGVGQDEHPHDIVGRSNFRTRRGCWNQRAERAFSACRSECIDEGDQLFVRRTRCNQKTDRADNTT